jgi:hypothetical protein
MCSARSRPTFAYAGSFVFGSGLAIVPFLYGGVVQEYHWLSDRQFVDAVAVAMITPGPVVITTGLHRLPGVGFLGCGGGRGRHLRALLLCFTILPAPYFKRHGKLPGHRQDLAVRPGRTEPAVARADHQPPPEQLRRRGEAAQRHPQGARATALRHSARASSSTA